MQAKSIVNLHWSHWRLVLGVQPSVAFCMEKFVILLLHVCRKYVIYILCEPLTFQCNPISFSLTDIQELDYRITSQLLQYLRLNRLNDYTSSGKIALCFTHLFLFSPKDQTLTPAVSSDQLIPALQGRKIGNTLAFLTSSELWVNKN